MKPDPRAAEPSSPPFITVLFCAPIPGDSPLSKALAGLGCRVEAVARDDDRAERLDLEATDVIVLDLSGGSGSGQWPGSITRPLEALRDLPVESRPALIAATSDGAPVEGIPSTVDAWVAGRHAALAARIVREAAAPRALSRALSEIGKLRTAVRFARDTAHDLAQPLTTVLARAQLLLGRLDPEDPHYRAVSIICQESERLARTVERFNGLKEMAPLPEPRGA